MVRFTNGWTAWISRAVLLFIAAILAATKLAGQSSPQRFPSASTRRSAGTDEDVLIAVRRVHIPSKAFHATRDAYVWMPRGEAVTATRYPVLVFPDAEETGQFRAALANIQFLINRELIPPLMVVGVPYFANRRHELTPPATGSTAKSYPAAGGADDDLRFIADELLPWIDAHYPTVPTRLIAGHSLGGLFVLHAMATRPALFRVVIAMSAPLWWNDGAFSPELASRIASDTAPRTLYLTSGTVGGFEAVIDSTTTTFAEQLTVRLGRTAGSRLRFERRRYVGDPHEMTPLVSLVDGLRMAFAPMLVPIDSVVALLSVGEHRDAAAIAAIAERVESDHLMAANSLGVSPRFPEAILNFLGSYALEAKHPRLAATLLRRNRDRYPQSSNAHESLAEALAAAGDTTGAVAELRTAVAIAQDTLRTTTSIISRTRARSLAAAATGQLRAMNRDIVSNRSTSHRPPP